MRRSHADSPRQRAEELRQGWLCPGQRRTNRGLIREASPSRQLHSGTVSTPNLQPAAAAATTGYVRVRHLPPGVTSMELFAFFRGYGLAPVDIHICPDNSKECLVQLSSVNRAKQLLAQRGRLFLFGSCLEVLPASEKEALATGLTSLVSDGGAGAKNKAAGADAFSSVAVVKPTVSTKDKAVAVTETPPVARVHVGSQTPRTPRGSSGADSVHAVKSRRAYSSSSSRSQHGRARNTSPQPSTPRAPSTCSGTPRSRQRSVNIASPRNGYSGQQRAASTFGTRSKRPPLPHDSTSAWRRDMGLQRAESAPPAMDGDLPVPARYWEYSAHEWKTAVSPSKLETLRHQLASVKRETFSLRAALEEDIRNCKDMAEQVEVGKLRLRDLREEEACVMSSSSAKKPVDARDSEDDLQLAVLRKETEILAGDVEAAAKMQMAHCESLRDMQIAARLARSKRGVQTAATTHDEFRAEHRCQQDELSEWAEATEALRMRMNELHSGVEQMRNEEAASFASSAERDAAQHEELAALRLNVQVAVEARRGASEALSLQHQTQEARRNNLSALSVRRSGACVAAQRLTTTLKNAGNQGSSIKEKLSWMQNRTRDINVEVNARRAACDLLAAELQQQCDATAAWQACAGDLAQGHRAISNETARVVNASREALCNKPVGFEEPRHWLHTDLPMPTY